MKIKTTPWPPWSPRRRQCDAHRSGVVCYEPRRRRGLSLRADDVLRLSMIGSFQSRGRPRWPPNVNVVHEPFCTFLPFFSCFVLFQPISGRLLLFWRHQGALYMCCKLRTVELFSCCTHRPLTLASAPCYTPPMLPYVNSSPNPQCFSIRACTLRAEFFTCCEDFFSFAGCCLLSSWEKKKKSMFLHHSPLSLCESLFQ